MKEILLMVQKSVDHQLRLVVYPIIYDGFYTSQVVVLDFVHQQHIKQIGYRFCRGFLNEAWYDSWFSTRIKGVSRGNST